MPNHNENVTPEELAEAIRELEDVVSDRPSAARAIRVDAERWETAPTFAFNGCLQVSNNFDLEFRIQELVSENLDLNERVHTLEEEMKLIKQEVIDSLAGYTKQDVLKRELEALERPPKKPRPKPKRRIEVAE